jgi:hypothetical protein
MKITTVFSLLAITLFTNFSSSLQAAEEPSTAMKLIKLMEFSKTAKAGASASFTPFLQQLKAKGLPEEGLKEMSEAAERFFSKTFDNPAIEVDIAKIYEENYTKEEMEELLKFYQTPAGKKSIEVMPKIMQESSKIGQKYAVQNQAAFQTEMQTIMAKYAPAPAPAPVK